MKLHELKKGQLASIEAISADSESQTIARRLEQIGFIEGELVHMLHKGPGGGEPFAVQVGQTLFALRGKEAEHVLVQAAEGV